MIEFEWPLAFVLLLLLPILGIIYILKQEKKEALTLKFSQLDLIKEASKGIINWYRYLVPAWFILSFILVTCIIAKPKAYVDVPVKASAIMVLFDISISMEADDMKPNRLYAAQNAALNFIKKIPDNVKAGLVYFCGTAYLAAPLDRNKARFISVLEDLELNDLKQGTAIGSAIKVAIQTFQKEQKKQDGSVKSLKNYILLITDGESNLGFPVDQAIDLAKNSNTPIFSIGIGSLEGAFVRDGILTRLDDHSLKNIAEETNGKYYRAYNEKMLEQIYNKLAKSAILYEKEKQDVSYIFAVTLLLLFITFAILKLTVFYVYP